MNRAVGLLLVAFFVLWGARCLFRVYEYLKSGRTQYWTHGRCLGEGARGKTPFAFWAIVVIYSLFGLVGTIGGGVMFVRFLLNPENL